MQSCPLVLAFPGRHTRVIPYSLKARSHKEWWPLPQSASLVIIFGILGMTVRA